MVIGVLIEILEGILVNMTHITKASANEIAKTKFRKRTKGKKLKDLSDGSYWQRKFWDAGKTLPICVNMGCDNVVTVREWKQLPSIKGECTRCINARKKGLEILGVKIHKKDFCENIDSHLGFKCLVKEPKVWLQFLESLDLDHVDGNHFHNNPKNVKTYCCICHGRKSLKEGDTNANKPSGRKSD